MALVVALTMHAACTGDDSDDDSSIITDPVETSDSTTSSTSSSSTTETTVDPQDELEAEVEAAYLAQWDAYVEILSDPNPENRLIDRHFTGASREAMLDGVSQMIADGRALREPDDPTNFSIMVRTVVVDGSSAELTSCVVDGLVQVDQSNDEVVNDAVVTVEFNAELRLEANQWKLAEHVVATRTDGASCDG